MNRFNKLNEKFDEMHDIIQDFMRKLSKKLKITLNHTKNNKIPSTNNLAELLFRVTFPGKNKKDLQNIQRCKKTNSIKQLKLDKKECFGRKLKIHQLNFLHSLINTTY